MMNWLDSLARNGSEDEVSHPALWAMALHASSAASASSKPLSMGTPGSILAVTNWHSQQNSGDMKKK